MTHVDTSFLIRSLVAASSEDKQLRRWMESSESLALSAIAWAEFACGPVNAEQLSQVLLIFGEPLAFTHAQAETAAELFNSTGRVRGKFVDCMIAAAALESGASLATSNPRDFVRFRSLGLQVVSMT